MGENISRLPIFTVQKLNEIYQNKIITKDIGNGKKYFAEKWKWQI